MKTFISKYRMVEITLDNGELAYGLQKKGWFGWRTQNFSVWGSYVTHHHDKSLVKYKLDVFREREPKPATYRVIQ